MKAIALSLLAILTAMCLTQPLPANTAASAAPSISQNSEYWEGCIYLKVKENAKVKLPNFDQQKSKAANYPHLSKLIQQHNIAKIYKPLTRLKTPFFDNVYKIEFTNKKQVEQLQTQLKELDFVEYSEKFPVFKSNAIPNDPAVKNNHLWFLETVKAYDAWDIAQGSSDVVVAVVDDAVKITHEDLKGSVWINKNEISNNGIDDDNNGYVDDRVGWDGAHNDNNPNPVSNASQYYMGHGTHVAGTAAAQTNNGRGIASIAHNVKLMACKSSNNVGLYGVFEALEYAIVNNADVINCSWGGKNGSTILEELVAEAVKRDIILVAAAGNENTSLPSFPAGYPEVISVASSTKEDKRSNFSNYGTTIDIVAPGSDIVSCSVEGTTNYFANFGTSMASPNVSSLIALMLSQKPELTPSQVKNCLLSTADNIDAKNPDYKGLLGAGRINALEAVRCAIGENTIICESPKNLVANDITANSALLKWGNGNGASKYNIQIKKGSGEWNTLPNGPFTGTSYKATSLKSNTNYSFKVKSICTGKASGYSSAFTFKTTGSSGGYCNASGDDTAGEWIASVEIGDLTNASGNNNGYRDYSSTNISADFKQGETYNLKLTPQFSGEAYDEYWRIWIDYNGDGDFNDSGELAFDPGESNQSVVNGTIDILNNAKVGQTRMRVAMKFYGSFNGSNDFTAPEACGNFNYGEVEDYSINILAKEPTTNPNNYCDAKGESSVDEWIEKVVINGINNTSGNNNGYRDYTNKSTDLKLGTDYSITLTPGFANEAYTERWRIWIDLNQDKDFEDAGELVFDSNTGSANEVKAQLSMPTTGTTGQTRMRVAMKFVGDISGTPDTAPPATCGTFSYGEVEDYTVNIAEDGEPPVEPEPEPEEGYCSAKGDKTSDEWIESVKIGNINKTSGDNGGYADFTHINTTLVKNNSYSFTLTPGFRGESYTEQWRIWIDLNQDEDFEDAGELVFDAPSPSKNKVQNSFTLPLSAQTGKTRMRVAMKFIGKNSGSSDLNPPESCGLFNFGEIEDYSVIISNTPDTGDEYCQNDGGDTTDEWIAKVTLGNIRNQSGNDGGYGDYTGMTAKVERGNSYLISLTPGFTETLYDEHWRVWVDLNQDGDFDEANELLYDSPEASAGVVKTALKIPDGVPLGKTRMRVAMKFIGTISEVPDTDVPTPCSEFGFGEVEDYSIEIDGVQSGCSAPTNLSIEEKSDNTILLKWGAVSGASSYEVQVKRLGASDWVSGTVEDTDADLNDVLPCTNYEFRVRAICSSGESNFSSRYEFKSDGCVLSACSRPSELAVSDLGETTARVSWRAVNDVDHYVVSFRNTGTITWQTLVVQNGTSTILQNLVNCLEYECKVQAVCVEGESNFSEVLTFNTVCSPCSEVTGVRAVGITPTSATLLWNKAAAGIEYEFRARPKGVTNWDEGMVDGEGALYFDLDPCTDYEVQVKTVCDSGTSAYSNTFVFTTGGCNGRTYCTSQGEFSDSEWIEAVSIGDFTNQSGNDYGYADYSHLTKPLARGENYNVNLTPGFLSDPYPEYWRIWIDFNADGDFEDAGELVFDANSSSTQTVTGSMLIPANATLGTTTMRVSMKWVDDTSDPDAPESCFVFSYGEVEDYTVEITTAVSVEEPIVAVSEIKAYPNPSNGQFTLQVNVPKATDATIQIFNATGQRVYQQEELLTAKWEQYIDLSNQPTGMYVVMVVAEGSTYQHKLLLTK